MEGGTIGGLVLRKLTKNERIFGGYIRVSGNRKPTNESISEERKEELQESMLERTRMEQNVARCTKIDLDAIFARGEIECMQEG